MSLNRTQPKSNISNVLIYYYISVRNMQMAWEVEVSTWMQHFKGTDDSERKWGRSDRKHGERKHQIRKLSLHIFFSLFFLKLPTAALLLLLSSLSSSERKEHKLFSICWRLCDVLWHLCKLKTTFKPCWCACELFKCHTIAKRSKL